jgi:uncharacterized protein YjiS (DUF1127 family)
MTLAPFGTPGARFWQDSTARVHDHEPVGGRRSFWPGVWGRLRDAVRRQAIRDELYRLSDRELADIGLVRGAIPHLLSKDRRR